MWARAWGSYRGVAVLVLNTVLLLVLCEVLAGVFIAVFPRPTPDDAFKTRTLRLQYYYQQAWAREYWTEHLEVIHDWAYAPYHLWRSAPYEGKHINIDGQGRRVTPNAHCEGDAVRVYFFGGSTMWGYGAPDSNTIPAYVQSNLPAICAVNWGELGYNSTQNLVLLQRLLAKGDVPDIVVFYDGNNDIATANRYGEAGTHMFLEAFLPYVRSRPQINAPLELLRHSNLWKVLVPPPTETAPPQLATPPFEEAFLDEVTNTYLANVRSLQALAREYDFEAFAFVQPVLGVVARDLNDEEQAFVWNVPYGFIELTREIYPRFQKASVNDARLIYLGNVLDDIDLPVWIDSHHVTPWGNLVVADAIASTIAPIVGEHE